MKTELIRKASIEELCAHRNRAMDAYNHALEFAEAANSAAKRAAPSKPYIGGAYVTVRGKSAHNRADLEDWRKSIDRDCWLHLLEASKLGALMGAKQKSDFMKVLQDNPPEFTVETAYATFSEKVASAGAIFNESVVHAFQSAPRGFKSNDRFHVGARMVFNYAVSAYGGWQYSSYGPSVRDIIRDLDRIMHILDRKPQETDATDIAAGIMHGSRTGECETNYFRFRWFKKGTLHVWFLRDDLVSEMNRILADHFGASLGAAA